MAEGDTPGAGRVREGALANQIRGLLTEYGIVLVVRIRQVRAGYLSCWRTVNGTYCRCSVTGHSLLAKFAEIGVRPHRDDLNKRAFVVWHELPDELVIEAESPATRR